MAKFKDLSLDLETGEHIDFDDADTIMMGYDGDELYLTSTLSGVRAVELYHMVRLDQLEDEIGGATTGSGSHTNIQMNYYKDKANPYAENANNDYLVVGSAPYTPVPTPFDYAKLVIRSEDTGNEHAGSMQIYDITNNNEIIEFSYSGIYDWTVVTGSGFSNIPTVESVWEVRIKKTTNKKGWFTHILLY